MDARPDLAVASAILHLDHAVFTSVRSVTGQGYRLVSRSRGLSEAEVRELMRCAPSHASLEDESSAGCGLAAARFADGRWAVLCVQAAGPEPSGRGGERIFTHALFLTGAQYAAFGNDPFRVLDARPSEQVSSMLAKLPPARIKPLEISKPEFQDKSHEEYEFDEISSRLGALRDAIAPDSRLILRGAPASTGRRLFASLPMERRLISVSSGIRCSPSRPYSIVFADPPVGELRRLTAGGEVCVIEWDELACELPPAHGPDDEVTDPPEIPAEH